MERLVKGIFVPIEIWESRELSWNEKVVFLEVDSFTRKGRDCFISDEYIANLVGCSTATAKRIVSGLIKKGYIRKTRFDGRHRFIESCLNFEIAGSANLSEQTGQNCDPTYNTSINKSFIDIKDNIDNKGKRFVKPSLDEVRAYCRERGNSVDPEAFCDFYESKGWKVGNQPMKDWQAAVRTWEKSRGTSRPTPKTAAAPSPKQSQMERMLALGAEMFGQKNDFYDEQ